MYTLDLPPGSTERSQRSHEACSIREHYNSGYLIDMLGFSGRIVRLQGDSALFDFSPYRNSIDLFFIDGAHTEDYVMNDTRAAFQCIKSDGMVVWHDCLNSAVLGVIRRYAEKGVPIKWIRGTSVAFAIGKPE